MKKSPLEYEKKYKRGKRTLLFIFIQKGWWMTLIGLGCIVLSWAMYFGGLQTASNDFFNSHADWYITTGMFSLWIFLAGISIIYVAYLRAHVYYRTYRFIIDEYALHLYRGIFFIRQTTIPYHHISNVNIEQPYHYKMFGIARLDIVTTAHSNPDPEQMTPGHHKKFLIPIIDISLARQLSRHLLEGTSSPNKPSRQPKRQNLDDFLEEEDLEDEYDEEEEDEDDFSDSEED